MLIQRSLKALSWTALSLMTLAAGTPPAHAQVFTRLASTGTPNIASIRDVSAPALNNNAVAAFGATIGVFSEANVYKVDSLGNATQVAAPIAFGPTPVFARPAINDSGLVAFPTTRFLNIFARIPGIYTATTATIAPTMIDETFDGLGNVNINNSGVLAYDYFSRVGQGNVTQIRRTTGPGSFTAVGTGNVNVPQTGSPSGDIVSGAALNNQGTVGFIRAGLNFPPHQVERVESGGASETFAPGVFLGNAGPAINDSGALLFLAGSDLVLSTAPDSFTPIAGTGTGFTNITGWSLNNSGDAVFTGQNGNVQAIFLALSGLAPVPVIRFGDSLFGSTVSGLEIHRDGLNDAGQLAFRYTLSNGEIGIALTGGNAFSASAPEPDTLALLSVFAAGGLAFLRRRKLRSLLP